MRTHPIEQYQALRDSAPCLSRAAALPKGTKQIGVWKRRTPGNIILSQPCRCRVSTDRPIREGSQLAASLEGEPGPTPAGKTLPHSYPETRFRRERGRGNGREFEFHIFAINDWANKTVSYYQCPCTGYIIVHKHIGVQYCTCTWTRFVILQLRVSISKVSAQEFARHVFVGV